MGGESLQLFIREEFTDEKKPILSQKEWKKRNVRQNGGEQESISQDGDLSDFGAVLTKSVSNWSVLISLTRS